MPSQVLKAAFPQPLETVRFLSPSALLHHAPDPFSTLGALSQLHFGACMKNASIGINH